MSVTINGTNGLTFNDASTQNTAATGFGFKNRIINGACMIDQRNAGASVTITNTSANTYIVDRWNAFGSQASKFSVQQNAGAVTTPSGFKNYLGATSASAYSITSSDQFYIGQFIEGFNVLDLGWGAAGASSVTISFWVRSSLTGTFGGAVVNDGYTRSYPFTFTISTANTWEQKTVTISGDTTGTWTTNNSSGIRLVFGLGVGSTYSGTAGSWAGSAYLSATGATSVVGTNGATFYITGVQLEKGSTATSFDYRPYGTELALCQRYYSVGSFYWAGASGSGVTIGGWSSFPATMRAAPTMSVTPFSYTNASGAAVTNTTTAGTGLVSTASNIASIININWIASAEL